METLTRDQIQNKIDAAYDCENLREIEYWEMQMRALPPLVIAESREFSAYIDPFEIWRGR